MHIMRVSIKTAVMAALSCCYASLMAQQVTITVNTRDGQTDNLQKALTAAGYDTDEELAAITDLKVTTEGKYQSGDREFDIALEESDFTFISQKLTGVIHLDLSEATVTNNYGEGRGASNSFPNNAFANNASIKTIVFPANLVGFGAGAFQNTALEGEVVLPATVSGAANCDNSRFGGSKGITGFVASEESNSIATVDGVLFNKAMTELHYYPAGKTDESYNVPEGVTIIRNGAFEFNDHLKNLTLSSTVHWCHTENGTNYTAWTSQSAIENIFVDEANEWLGSSNGVLYTKDRNRAVMSPRGKKELILAEPIQVIAGGGSQNAIFGGNGKTSVGGVTLSCNYTKVVTMADFPATLDTIENGAFVSADSLEYIICRAEEVPYTYVNTFRNVGTYYGWQTKVYVPAASLEAYKNSFWVDKASRPTESGGTETNGGGFQQGNFFAYYNIKVEYGTAQSSIAADVAPETDVVTLTAADRTAEGLVFDGWTCTSGNVAFVDASAATTTFTMPAADVEIAANYKEQGTTTGLDAVTAEPLAIYPNPATSYIRISGDQGTPYAIYSITGKVVAQGTLTGEAIPVADLHNGLYVVKAGDKASRFVKE